MKGIAYGGDRGVSRVEFSSDGGKSWRDADIYYSGGNLAWSLWKTAWIPNELRYYTLVVRATDGTGNVQKWEEDRGPFSGAAGLHEIGVSVTA